MAPGDVRRVAWLDGTRYRVDQNWTVLLMVTSSEPWDGLAALLQDLPE